MTKKIKIVNDRHIWGGSCIFSFFLKSAKIFENKIKYAAIQQSKKSAEIFCDIKLSDSNCMFRKTNKLPRYYQWITSKW